MFLIYGISQMTVKEGKLSQCYCPKCNKVSHLHVKIAQKYAQFFWIPLFPIWKSGIVTCEGCKEEIATRNLPQLNQEEYKQIRKSARTPRRTFIGVVVLSLLIGKVVFNSLKNDAKEKIFVENPQIGDVYTYQTEEGNYRLLKAIAIESDSILYQKGIREKSDVWSIPDLQYGDYASDTLVMSKTELKDLFDKGTIRSIERHDAAPYKTK
jgi:zinc-ribbon family